MGSDERIPDTTSSGAPESLALMEVDEFDLDIQLGELGQLSRRWLGMPYAAQTDPQCVVPTGGTGAGTTCNTNDNTCGATCAGLNTCPQTQCGNTCPQTQCGNTCGATCGNTCPATDCQTCDCQTMNRHVFTCATGCDTP